MNTKEKDSQYIMHTYGRYNVALKSGKGATAYDEDGKKYVDCLLYTSPSPRDTR